MKNRKLIVAVIAVALIVALGVIGTIAWLLDSKTNDTTFTVGNVHLASLENAAYAHHLIPGSTYTMSPVVTVKGTSEEAYVRMIVTIADGQDVLDVLGYDADEDDVNDSLNFAQYFAVDAAWSVYNTEYVTTGDKIVVELRYNTTVAKADTDTALAPAFTTFSVPSKLTNEDLETISQIQINIVAQAIQAENMGDNANTAWSEFAAQTGYTFH